MLPSPFAKHRFNGIQGKSLDVAARCTTFCGSTDNRPLLHQAALRD
jgi:hypothetical protein